MKPGQFVWINGGLYRAQKRVNSCEGCIFKNTFKCPNLGNSPSDYTINCILDNIILVKV